MSKYKFGPWEVVIDGTCSGAWPHIVPTGTHQDDVNGNTIAELPTTHIEKSTRGFPGTYVEKPERFQNTADHDEIMAAAHLIAAAPELLALLVESQRSIGGDWRERRDAAIAKATGEA